MIFLISFILIVVSLFIPINSFADNNSFVTIVNPVRISPYNNTPTESLKAEYEVVSENNLKATWLVSYDVLKNPGMISLIKTFSNEHEIGLFFEISDKFSEDASVSYDKSFSWHHPANIFLTGYTQDDRKKLIDTLFENFKKELGYYPKSVGAWWIDSYSLSYMHDSYGVTANLGLADQYSTDGYRVWGTYWSTPFYPSNIHAGLPGKSENKLDVVTMQWAARDPLNGYENSYFSTQDYLQTPVNQNTSYFEKLVRLYSLQGKNSFGHIVIGLESDLNPNTYEDEYSKQLEVIKNMKQDGEADVINMKDFSEWYKDKFKNESPPQFVSTSDFMGQEIKTFWYQSPNYRIGINYNIKLNDLEVFDFRVYQENFQEPYYFTPNKDFRLLVDVPSVIDKFTIKNSWKLNFGKLIEEKVSDGKVDLEFTDGNLKLGVSDVTIENVSPLEIPRYIEKTKLVEVENLDNILISPKNEFEVGPLGYTFKRVKPEIENLLKTKKTILIIIIFLALILLIILNIFRSKQKTLIKILIITLLLGGLGLISAYWLFYNSITYFVGQSEIDSLNHLRLMEDGDVLIYDGNCTGCEWHTPNKPAIFDNKRNYVKRFTGKKVIKNDLVFDAKDPITAGQEFEKTGAKYIYVVNYEEYKEKVPFSPGDLGIELVYENANSQIWKRKN